MKRARKGASQDAVITVDSSLSVAGVLGLRDRLVAAFAVNDRIVLDLSKAQGEPDTAVLQLICSAWKSANDANKRFAIAGGSDVLAEAASGIGVDLDPALRFQEVGPDV